MSATTLLRTSSSARTANAHANLHPDSTGGDPEAEIKFKETTVAYEVLRDPERRRRYDMFGPDGVDAQAQNDGRRLRRGPRRPSRGVLQRRYPPARCEVRAGARVDAETVLSLTFQEAVFGTSKEMTVETAVACSACEGSGARPGTTATRCDECAGTGEMRRVRQSILGQVVTAFPCNRCGGNGEVISSPCPECRGDGRRAETRTFTVDIPAGVDHGSTLRLSGRGPAGPRGGPSGRPLRPPFGDSRRALRTAG